MKVMFNSLTVDHELEPRQLHGAKLIMHQPAVFTVSLCDLLQLVCSPLQIQVILESNGST